MKTLILGGNGRTGKLVVQELLKANHPVRLLVRDRTKLPDELLNNPSVECVEGSITSLSDNQLEEYIKGCSTVVSCLGKNPTFSETFGGQKLVSPSTERIHNIAKKLHEASPSTVTRFILMNGSMVFNKDFDSPSWTQRFITSLLKTLMTAFRDNVDAAEFLRSHPNTPGFEWSVVRPGQLIDKSEVSEYTMTKSTTTSLSETTLRINVADAMRRLITSDECWKQWKGLMPVVHDKKA